MIEEIQKLRNGSFFGTLSWKGLNAKAKDYTNAFIASRRPGDGRNKNKKKKKQTSEDDNNVVFDCFVSKTKPKRSKEKEPMETIPRRLEPVNWNVAVVWLKKS
jgi:hypothetical protein